MVHKHQLWLNKYVADYLEGDCSPGCFYKKNPWLKRPRGANGSCLKVLEGVLHGLAWMHPLANVPVEGLIHYVTSNTSPDFFLHTTGQYGWKDIMYKTKTVIHNYIQHHCSQLPVKIKE